FSYRLVLLFLAAIYGKSAAQFDQVIFDELDNFDAPESISFDEFGVFGDQGIIENDIHPDFISHQDGFDDSGFLGFDESGVFGDQVVIENDIHPDFISHQDGFDDSGFLGHKDTFILDF
ncbi:unnamed protein product, partial [Meganyctiphanes norvegica]